MPRVVLLLLTVFLLAAPVTGGGPTATFIPLGDLPGGGFDSYAAAVSRDGTTVVGRSISAPPMGFDQPYEAYRWTATTGMIGLGDLDGGTAESFAHAVSSNGAVVVGTTDTGAFRWTQAAGMELFEDATGELVLLRPTGVSDDGSVISGHGDPASGGNVIFRWTEAGGVVNLGALPTDHPFPDGFGFDLSADGSAITGLSLSTSPDVEPILWTEAGGLIGLGDVPGGFFYAIGEGISGDGTRIGGGARTGTMGSLDEAFLWDAARGFVFTDPLRGAVDGSTIYALDRDGSIAVGYDGSVTGGAMIWDETHGRRSVQEILDRRGVDLTGWLLRGARDISADGTVIVGTGTNPFGDNEAWLAVIPRAASAVPVGGTMAWLVLLGLVLATGFVVLRAPATGDDHGDAC
jgi:uncharacterized membrane protein